VTGERKRPTLLLPLLALPRPAADDQLVGSAAEWATRITEAQETCLMLDDRGRVVALSTGCALMLDLDPVAALGKALRDLVVLVDFSATGLPVDDPEAQLPPLKALRSGTMARALIRLRLAREVLTTYDVVGVPLAGGVGALGFFSEV
jgi:hypothetical protein